jgi:recombination protein RecA
MEKLSEALNRQFGPGIIGRASDLTVSRRVSTGSASLDWGIGGGLPVSRIVEFFGYPSSGKTLVSLRQVKNYQRAFGDRLVGWIDAENSWDEDWAEAIGVDCSSLYLGKPDTGNQAFDMLEQLIRTNEFSLLVLDSLGMVPAQQEIERSMEQLETGVKARMGNKGVRKLQSALNWAARHGTHTTVILINHIYLDLSGFRPKKTTPGGRGKEYADALAIEFMARKELKIPKDEDPNEDQYGLRVGFYVKKSKVSVPHRTGEFEVFIQDYKGHIPGDFSRLEYVPFLLRAGIVERSGSWYTIPESTDPLEMHSGERVQGVDSVVTWLDGLSDDQMEDLHEQCLTTWNAEIPEVPGDGEGAEGGEPGAGEPGGEGSEGPQASG